MSRPPVPERSGRAAGPGTFDVALDTAGTLHAVHRRLPAPGGRKVAVAGAYRALEAGGVRGKHLVRIV